MDDIRDSLEHHRSRLLRYLGGEDPATKNQADAQACIGMVLREWHQRFSSLDPPPAGVGGEDDFVRAVPTSKANGIPGEGDPDPYEAVLMKDLARARELQRNWQARLRKSVATRPDGT